MRRDGGIFASATDRPNASHVKRVLFNGQDVTDNCFEAFQADEGQGWVIMLNVNEDGIPLGIGHFAKPLEHGDVVIEWDEGWPKPPEVEQPLPPMPENSRFKMGDEYPGAERFVFVDGEPMIARCMFKDWALAGPDDDPSSFILGTMEVRIIGNTKVDFFAHLIRVHTNDEGIQEADEPALDQTLEGVRDDIDMQTFKIGGQEYVLACTPWGKHAASIVAEIDSELNAQ